MHVWCWTGSSSSETIKCRLFQNDVLLDRDNIFIPLSLSLSDIHWVRTETGLDGQHTYPGLKKPRVSPSHLGYRVFSLSPWSPSNDFSLYWGLTVPFQHHPPPCVILYSSFLSSSPFHFLPLFLSFSANSFHLRLRPPTGSLLPGCQWKVKIFFMVLGSALEFSLWALVVASLIGPQRGGRSLQWVTFVE